MPDAAAVKDGLFPEDACKELEASGFKCMGLKPAVKYSLPASSFKVGSAELPELLKKQLDVFAEVLRSKKGSGPADQGRPAMPTPRARPRRTSRCRSSAPKPSRNTWSQKGADPTC